MGRSGGWLLSPTDAFKMAGAEMPGGVGGLDAVLAVETRQFIAIYEFNVPVTQIDVRLAA